ncbi:Peptidyl-prolyl cis-trans isomerase CWC27 like protein [Eufriesea mexicana]|nr:Peptidyl-prolyl cis-trans isomerase CWC27 like protein [Eufriesea mexicana]
MNGIIRNTLRSSIIRNSFSSISNSKIASNQSRALWNIPRQSEITSEKELVEFLAEEIIAEKEAQKLRTIPTELEGFKVSLDGAEVNLEKRQNNEKIKISFNINHTIESGDESQIDMDNPNQNTGDMKSKPSFSVDIIRGNQTLGFTCSFNTEPGASDEITLYSGEHNDKVYAVAGEVIDGYLYDLLMNYLEEKGISNEFAEKLIEFSTNYEHTAYDDTVFHGIIEGFITQGVDSTGTGEDGKIYGEPFKGEFYTRLHFCRRDLIAMANAGRNENGFQFFFALSSTPDLLNKHTIFGKVTGETIYIMLKLEEALVDENDRPLYTSRLIKTIILNNPFSDIIPRLIVQEEFSPDSIVPCNEKFCYRDFNLLSFGGEAKEDEEESVILNKKFTGKGKSAHDHLTDPKLSSQPAVEPSGLANK